jgi:hypothetical protein
LNASFALPRGVVDGNRLDSFDELVADPNQGQVEQGRLNDYRDDYTRRETNPKRINMKLHTVRLLTH